MMPGKIKLLPLLILLQACSVGTHQNQPPVSPDTTQAYLIQSRLIRSGDQASIASAASAVLKEMGFEIESAGGDPGLLSARRSRETDDASVLAGIAVLGFYLLTHSTSAPPWSSSKDDAKAVVKASVEIQPDHSTSAHRIRLLLFDVTYDGEGRVSRDVVIDEPEMYDRFFSMLQITLGLQVEQAKLPG